MVWQTAERLKDYESPAAMFCMVNDFSRDQDSFSGIKGMMDNGVTVFHQILHTAGWCVKRTLPGNFVCHIMSCIKSRIGSPQPYFLCNRLIQMIFPNLSILIKVGLSDNVCHPCLYNLKTVLLQ